MDQYMTPFKLFHLRKTYLVWACSKKFDKLFTPEEQKILLECEEFQFKSSVAMKAMSILCFMHLRFLWRPKGRPLIYDMWLIYSGLYFMLGSNIPGVHYTWQRYSHLVDKMFTSEKLRKRGLRNTNEFLDESRIPDYRVYLHYADIQFGKYY